MTQKGNISAFQLFSIMFLSRAVSLFTFMLPEASEMPALDRALSALPVIVFEIIYSFIIFAVIKTGEKEGFISKLNKAHPAAGKFYAAVFICAFIWFAGISVSRFELFMSTVMFPTSDLKIPALLLIAAAFIGAVKGLEATGRTSVLIFFMVILSVSVILFSVAGDFRYTNLKPVFNAGFLNNIRYAFYMSVRYGELPAVYVMAPYVKGSLRKMTTALIFSYGALSAAVLFILSGVTGEYGDMQMFQLYTLTIIAKNGLFERMDDILISIWVLCALINTSFFLLCAQKTCMQISDRINNKIFTGLCAAAVFIIYLISSETMMRFTEFAGSYFHGALFLCVCIILPSAAFIINRKRQKT